MPRGRPLLRQTRLPFRHGYVAVLWRWLEDLNLPPLAYEASARPDELSQRSKLSKMEPVPLPVWKQPSRVCRDSASEMDVNNVKERGAIGAVVTGVGVQDPARAQMHIALPAHERSLDIFWWVLRIICPPASAEGGPCAGYSGLRIEPCPARSIDLEEFRFAQALTNRQSLGLLNPAAALSAVAICDALNSIGVLSSR